LSSNTLRIVGIAVITLKLVAKYIEGRDDVRPTYSPRYLHSAGINGYPPGHYLLLCRTCRSRPNKHAHSTHCGITEHPLCLCKDLFFFWKISFVTSVCILPLVRAFDWVGCVNMTSEQKELCIIFNTSTCNIYFLI
jgi:hypothetical protein